MKKECELCNSPATMYCESDRASLCWNCDSKIHSANFLVAKHVRCLLCHICQSPSPWKASGAKLGSTLTACRSCAANRYKEIQAHQVEEAESAGESHGGNEEEESEVESDETSNTNTTEEEEEETDNQVVPWTSSSSSSKQLQLISSSSGEEESPRSTISLKRLRDSEDDLCCSASSSSSSESSFRISRPLKARKTSLLSTAVSELESDMLLNSLRKFHQQNLSASTTSETTDLDMCRDSKDAIAFC